MIGWRYGIYGDFGVGEVSITLNGDVRQRRGFEGRVKVIVTSGLSSSNLFYLFGSWALFSLCSPFIYSMQIKTFPKNQVELCSIMYLSYVSVCVCMCVCFDGKIIGAI